MTDRRLVQALEERLVNVWPAVETLLMDGWAVRFANGYSGRANSASAIVQDAVLTPRLLDEIERLYRAAGLPPQVRVTPVCDASVEPLLLARGYAVKDRSRIMALPLDAHRGRAPDIRVRLEVSPSPAWIAGVCSHQSPDKRNEDHLLAIVGRIRGPAAFGALEVDGRTVGFGMCAVDRGWAEIGSVVLDAAMRGRGLGRATVDALLAWASGKGADNAFLQVDERNAVARGLYASQGFRDLAGYMTMRKG
ncbi:MAG: GNAT family N-acetyltransferase [Beijerinckiaceae bacterium]